MLLAVVLFLLCLNVVIWYAASQASHTGVLTVSFLNIGQGDAIYIESPTGQQVLIDGGKNRAVLRELSKMTPWFDRTLDVVIGTHPDLDHIGGLPDVLTRYRVSTVMRSSVHDEEGTDFAAFNKAIETEKNAGANEVVAARGQIIDIGGDAYIQILFPDRDVPLVETNTGSIVTRLVYGDTAFMLTGDSPESIEEYLVRLDGSKLRSTVLKAGHHGSRTSSSPLFVGFVDPEYVVFSRGCDNTYGHPHEEVVELFKRFEIQTFDTCTNRRVTFMSDGNTVTLKK
ncbi:MAG: beta-lactamase domain-containing protein [Parcubacteria group bacterium Gr01-1014_8]|nr:MAG: beta-lactamase domain-containing protein [Parcubacteria group bacterium Gr01-1014_8]